MLSISERFHALLRSAAVVAVIVLPSHHVLAAPFTIPSDQLSDLRDQRVLLANKVKELDGVSKQITVTKADRRSAISSIGRLQDENEQARIKLEKLQKFDRDNPGMISQDQLRGAEDQNRKSFAALQAARDRKDTDEAKISTLGVDASTRYADFLRLQKSFERDVDRVVDAQLQERLRALQVKKQVTATEQVPCGNDSIPVCKERSKKAAELKASETGSVVFVNSLTEVKNFKLSREEIRSEVQATLSNKVFSNQHLVGETAYETTITANVEPAIGDQLREQMRGSIRAQVYDMIGGGTDFSQVQDPSLLATLDNGDYSPAPRAASPSVQERPVPRETVTPQPEPAPAPVRRRIEKPTFTF